MDNREWKSNMKVGFTCSSFDLFHAGHVMMLKEAKEQCGYLIVGLQSDPTIDRPEKNKPVAPQKKNDKKDDKMINILGCTYKFFITYLESKFENWMNFDNYGLYNGELNYDTEPKVMKGGSDFYIYSEIIKSIKIICDNLDYSEGHNYLFLLKINTPKNKIKII